MTGSTAKKFSEKYHTVKSGDTVSELAVNMAARRNKFKSGISFPIQKNLRWTEIAI